MIASGRENHPLAVRWFLNKSTFSRVSRSCPRYRTLEMSLYCFASDRLQAEEAGPQNKKDIKLRWYRVYNALYYK